MIATRAIDHNSTRQAFPDATGTIFRNGGIALRNPQ